MFCWNKEDFSSSKKNTKILTWSLTEIDYLIIER